MSETIERTYTLTATKTDASQTETQQKTKSKVQNTRPSGNPITNTFNRYSTFVTQNASQIGQLEGALRTLTYIIPARFKDVELASETIHSGISLLSLYHDSLLSRSAMPSTNAPPPKPTLHNRYTKFWSKKSPLYRKVAILITIIQYTELLWEMAAKRRGEQARWRVVIGLEAAKAVCRLILLRLTKGRPLLTQPLPEREAEPEQLPPSSSNESTAPSTPPSEAELSWKMPRTGFHLPTLPSNISAYLLSRVLTPDDIKPAPSLLPNLHGSAILAEVLYILRPLIYVMMLEKYADDKKSWKPWLVGFGIEYASRELLKKKVGGYGTLEKEEMARREWGLMWWAARSAGYENLVGPWVKGMTEGMKGRPLVGMLAGVVEDYQYLWDNYYFSTATL